MSESISDHYLDIDFQTIKSSWNVKRHGERNGSEKWEGENGISLIAQLQNLGCQTATKKVL